VLVCGHSHQPGVVAVPGGTYVNTGSWAFEDSTYATYADGRIEVRRWPEQAAIHDEEYRGILGADAGKSFFDWWAAHYRGFLRYDLGEPSERLAASRQEDRRFRTGPADVARVVHGRARWLVELLTRA